MQTLACGEVIQRPHGHVTLESFPINAKCEWTLQVGQGATVELRYLLLKSNELLVVQTFLNRFSLNCKYIAHLYSMFSHYSFSQCSHVFRFSMVSLESDHSCQYDYLEVRDGDSPKSPVIGRYCGDESPSPIRSSGDSLHIRFVSDGYNNYDGFFATFQEISGTK